MEVLIEKLDNEGRGIGYINNKIIFIPKCLPGELVDITIIKENKKYYEGKLNNIIISSNKRINPPCEYFNTCGCCNLLNLKYEDIINYKINNVKEIFNKYLNYDINISNVIECDKFNYRNKVILHIKNNIIGLYDELNNVINIDNCKILEGNINNSISYIKDLNIKNGNILIRNNYLNKILISIDTKENLNINNIPDYVEGILLNNKIIYGNDYFIESINDLKFKVSYKSFFQVNRYITSELFNIIKDNIKNKNVLDLYCGVGTLGINASFNASKVIGIDNLKSNIKDANYNKELNKLKNIDFIHGDSSIFPKYINKIDTLIVDPPRNGLNKDTLKNILEYKPTNIIYVSCNIFTLIRDLKDILKYYNIKRYYLLDMFPFTYHCESICILERK